ncbi:hypothetical protein BJX63DRAFT_161724 [Aspergillus granulosus]|uniref:Uncharacterized protein n=1 Tax=Aspergillus granulosus TaxID=176169 RepID=A0ABR4HJQ2_9EURO
MTDGESEGIQSGGPGKVRLGLRSVSPLLGSSWRRPQAVLRPQKKLDPAPEKVPQGNQRWTVIFCFCLPTRSTFPSGGWPRDWPVLYPRCLGLPRRCAVRTLRAFSGSQRGNRAGVSDDRTANAKNSQLHCISEEKAGLECWTWTFCTSCATLAALRWRESRGCMVTIR